MLLTHGRVRGCVSIRNPHRIVYNVVLYLEPLSITFSTMAMSCCLGRPCVLFLLKRMVVAFQIEEAKAVEKSDCDGRSGSRSETF